MCNVYLCMCIFALLMFNTITLILINEYLKDSDKCNSAGWSPHGPVDMETQCVEMATWIHRDTETPDTRRHGDTT